MTDDHSLLSAALDAARKGGADAADAMLAREASLSSDLRLGEIEKVERAESVELGLRVFVGRRVALVAANDPKPGELAGLAERAVAMARILPEDPLAGLADRFDGGTGLEARLAELDLLDDREPAAERLTELARRAEDAARSVAGVVQTESAASWGMTRIALATSTGFAGGYATSRWSVSAGAFAGEGTAMERDYDYATAIHEADLDAPEEIGRIAGKRTVARLHATRPRSATMPVVYDPRVAGSLLGHLASAANAASIARGTSFLRDAMGERLFAPGITVRDDPHRRRGLRSRPFDAEGMAGAGRALVEDGILTFWFSDWRSARQLKLEGSSGHAGRSVGGQPSPGPSNLWLEPGPDTPASLMADIGLGLYVTELIGMGVNGVTGDYSRGAAGFLIRDGQLAEAVSEITVAGHLRSIFASMRPANDLRFRRGTDSPTVRVDGLTVAGA